MNVFVTFMIPVLEEVTLKIPIPGTYLYLKCFATFKIPILEEIVGKEFKIWVSYIKTFKIYVS